MNRRVLISLVVLAGLLAAVVILRLAVGGDLGTMAADARMQAMEFRWLRVASGVAVGVCLAVGGVMLQSLLRNPLASPDVLGLASGAGLAVMLTIALAAGVLGSTAGGAGGGEATSLGYGRASWHAGPALVGAMAVLAIVYALGQRRGLIDPVSLILVGVVVSIMCGAATMLVQHMMPGGAMGAQWLLVGSLTDDVQWGQITMAAPVALAGLAIGVWAGPAMDAATLADDEASSVGVRIGRLRAVLFVAAGAMTAAAVTVAGPIGFVGLICPHVVRLMAGGGAAVPHRWLVIGSALAGAALIVGADAAVKIVYLDTGRMPLGVITTVVGGVVFLGLLRREIAGLGR